MRITDTCIQRNRERIYPSFHSSYLLAYFKKNHFFAVLPHRHHDQSRQKCLFFKLKILHNKYLIFRHDYYFAPLSIFIIGSFFLCFLSSHFSISQATYPKETREAEKEPHNVHVHFIIWSGLDLDTSLISTHVIIQVKWQKIYCTFITPSYCVHHYTV